MSFGSQNLSTATVQNAAEGFTGWMTTTLIFTASGSSDVLSFLSSSTPNGVPPYILLSDVSVNFVPEPSSLALLSTGLVTVVGVGLRRRAVKSRNA